jgi:hypothetical protein
VPDRRLLSEDAFDKLRLLDYTDAEVIEETVIARLARGAHARV